MSQWAPKLPARGYPTASVMNWRTPLHLSSVAALRIPTHMRRIRANTVAKDRGTYTDASLRSQTARGVSLTDAARMEKPPAWSAASRAASVQYWKKRGWP
jgi:hypothetical protein